MLQFFKIAMQSYSNKVNSFFFNRKHRTITRSPKIGLQFYKEIYSKKCLINRFVKNYCATTVQAFLKRVNCAIGGRGGGPMKYIGIIFKN